jgi:hypothetical protein
VPPASVTVPIKPKDKRHDSGRIDHHAHRTESHRVAVPLRLGPRLVHPPRILPRIGIEYEFTDSRPDFLVGIYEALDEDAPARELRFMVSGECGERFPKITRGFKFVNAPDPSDDRAWTRSSRLFQSLEVNRPALPTLGASPPLNFFKPNALTFE